MLVASAPNSSSGVGRLGDGGCSDIGRRGEAVCVEESVPVIIGVGRSLCSAGASEAGAEGTEGPEASTSGGEATEAAWRARERRS